MNKVFLIIAVVAGVYYFVNSGPRFNTGSSSTVTGLLSSGNTTTSQQFHCDGRQHCSQMTSRAEAEFFVRHCPNTKMDGDHDGIPCENDSRW